ncbi:hypothetical protein HTG_02315 [Natrinema mahii]|nr:hypothetical protein HTG_02315 [Natrinema mahii]
MNARKQVLVVLTALMVVCSGGAMVTAASGSGAVDSGDTTGDGEYDSANETESDETTTDDAGADENDTEPVVDEDQATTDNDTGLEEDAAGQQSAYVTFEDQETDGQTVVVENVTLASGGFVTIHDSSLLVGDVFESVIGTSAYLEAGTHEQVEVTLDEPLEEDETLIAMPHRDTNDNETYDFVESEGAADGPYLTADDEPVTDDAVVSVGAADEEPVAEEPAEEDNETVVDDEPVEEDNETVGDSEPVEEDNETVGDDEPVEEDNETVGDDEPVEEDNETVGDDEPVEEDNETVVDDEPVEEDNETVGDDEPVEEDNETVVDEPADEDEDVVDEPAMDDGLTINVVIEQLTVIVGENGDGLEMNGEMDAGDEQADDGATVDENETDTDDETESDTTDDGTAADVAGLLGDGDISLEQVTITVDVENIEIQSASDAPSQGDGAGDDPDTETDDTAAGTDDAADGDDGAVADDGDQQGDQIQVTIEEATVNVNLGGMDEQPVEDEPAEDEEPVEEEPTENNETEDDLEPIEDEPADNETEDNETEDDLEPIEDEPADNETEDNETEEEPVDNETEPAAGFEVSNLDAPASAEVGDTITVTATIENPSDEERTETAQFRLDGDLVDEQNVTLEGDESDDVEFEVDTSDLAAGDYIHMILADQTGEVATLELTEATDDTETDDTELEDGEDGLGNDTDTNETADNGTDDGLENDTDEEPALVGA